MWSCGAASRRPGASERAARNRAGVDGSRDADGGGRVPPLRRHLSCPRGSVALDGTSARHHRDHAMPHSRLGGHVEQCDRCDPISRSVEGPSKRPVTASGGARVSPNPSRPSGMLVAPALVSNQDEPLVHAAPTSSHGPALRFLGGDVRGQTDPKLIPSAAVWCGSSRRRLLTVKRQSDKAFAQVLEGFRRGAGCSVDTA